MVDGRSLILSGSKLSAASQGIYHIDVRTGEESLVTQIAHPALPEWSADGRGIIYVKGDSVLRPPMRLSLMYHDLETGQERERGAFIFTPPQTRDVAISPDFQKVALAELEEETRSLVLKVVPVAGGEPRELTRVAPPETIGALAWTSDGRYLLFKKLGADKTGNQPARQAMLCRVSVEDGTAPQPTDLTALDLDHLRVHPDGRQIALTINTPDTGELWVMEDFLPTAKAEK